MAGLTHLARERSDLSDADIEHLHALVVSWNLLADLAQSDLVLWLPTWNQTGVVAAALVRPSTAPTAVPEDIVGHFLPRGRRPEIDRAITVGRPVRGVQDVDQLPSATEAYPIRREGRVIAVITREVMADRAGRVSAAVEGVYLCAAHDLFVMLSEGTFPWQSSSWGTNSPPRVGDGFLRLDASGEVLYASPNAQSVLRRLGLATSVTGQKLALLGVRLSHRPGPVDESIGLVLGGRIAGSTEIENASASMTATSVPLRRGSEATGAIVLVRDVTELRRRERALLTKEASIREIHHRVKNNLQTVAALLRLQARRVEAPEAQTALREAVRRVGAVAVVHDMLAHEPGDDIDVDDVIGRVIALERDLAPAHARGGAVPQIACSGRMGSLPVEVASPLAMALSEVLHNAVEHAAATHVAVACQRGAEGIEVSVTDDGGASAADVIPGLGLQIVRTLVEDELGGQVTIGSSEGSGLRVVLTVPVSA